MYSVIIIDDEMFFRKSLITTFPWQNFYIEVKGEAGNGRDGLKLLELFKPDIAIIDINMPGINGLQFIKKGQEINPNTKYILFQDLVSLYMLRKLSNWE